MQDEQEQPAPSTLGQAAYAAHAVTKAENSHFTMIVSWDYLPPATQQAWEAAAADVERRVLARTLKAVQESDANFAAGMRQAVAEAKEPMRACEIACEMLRDAIKLMGYTQTLSAFQDALINLIKAELMNACGGQASPTSEGESDAQ